MPADSVRQNVEFPSNGNTAHGYLAVPASGAGPGVVVIQEWWGLTDHIAGITDRLAEAGFVALAPDLFGGKTTHDADEAAQLMQQLPAEQAVRDLSGAVDFLIGHESVSSASVGTIGFCMGGWFVLLLAAHEGLKVSAAVPFYGVGKAEPGQLAGITAAVQGHYGEKDEFFPAAQAREQEEQIRKESGADVEYFYYPAGHAFHNDENLLKTYDAEQADLAWSRAVEFLKEKVR